MGKNLKFTAQELRFLSALIRHRVKFMVVGLSAAMLQGAPVVTQDVDLWFRDLADDGIRKALKTVKGFYVAPTASSPPMFGGDAVALFDIVLTMHGLESFDQEYKRAVNVKLGRVRIKVLPLARIILSKKSANRPKDKLTVPVLEDSLVATKQNRRRKK